MELKKKLSDEQLSAVTGGAYTAEAQAWLDRNRDVIEDRLLMKAPAYMLGFMVGMEMNSIIMEVSLDYLKNSLSEYIDVSDLT